MYAILILGSEMFWASAIQSGWKNNQGAVFFRQLELCFIMAFIIILSLIFIHQLKISSEWSLIVNTL